MDGVVICDRKSIYCGVNFFRVVTRVGCVQNQRIGPLTPAPIINQVLRISRSAASQPRRSSILSHIKAATSGPPKVLTERMPVGDVTLISVR